ncbi:MAG: NAD-binding protein, partial [Planctomycetota bacterium]
MNSSSVRVGKSKVISTFFSWLRSRAASLILILALVALITGFVGTLLIELKAHKPTSVLGVVDLFTGSVYEGAQATLMSMSPHRKDSSENFFIIVSRVTAICLAILVAIEAIGRLFKDSFRSLRMSLSHRKKVLVCGLGRIGYQKTIELLDEGKLVIVVDNGDCNHRKSLAEKAGAIVFDEDVTDILGLKEHILRGPAEIYLLTGDDSSNITALSNIRALRDQQLEVGATKELPPVLCQLHITDSGLEQEVRRSQIERDASSAHDVDPLQVRIFNIFAQTARQLITEDLADCDIRPRTRDEVALYVVYGFGEMGQAMVKEISELAHFENEKRSRILVLTPNAEKKCDDYLTTWGRLSPRIIHSNLNEISFDSDCDAWGSRKNRPVKACQVESEEAVEYSANVQFCEYSASAISKDLVDELVRLAEEPGVCPTVLFCCDEGEQNFKLANQLNESLKTV